MVQNGLCGVALQEIIECVTSCKRNEQYIPPQTDPAVGLFRDMLLVSAYRHLGSNNVVKRSTYDGAAKDYRMC